jgi:hypothetical protein
MVIEAERPGPQFKTCDSDLMRSLSTLLPFAAVRYTCTLAHNNCSTYDMNQQQSLWTRWNKVSLPNKLTVGCTFIIAIATCFYTWFAYHQWRIMAGQLNQMQNGTRPWVGVQEINGIQTDSIVIAQPGWISTAVTKTIKNFGNYPGSIVDTWADLVLSDGLHTSEIVSDSLKQCLDAKIPTGNGPSSTLFPGETYRHINTTVGKSSPLIERPLSAKLMAFLVGRIVYTDPSGNPHHTCFSYLYQTPGTIFPITFELTVGTTLPTGNWVEWKTQVN